MRVLISGGAGFVGSYLAKLFRSELSAEVVVIDNLKRRGSELNIKKLKNAGATFCHGDIRIPDDLNDLDGNFDLFVEASAEPSVHAGTHGNPNYAIQTNLSGTLNCLEFARKRAGLIVFLSTSRVYSIKPLRSILLDEQDSRLEISPKNEIAGLSEKGIAENFATNTARSIYGASKLASELMIQEYAETYNLRSFINRCGVIAGPGQFGKVDQGVFTLWVANHYFGNKLGYFGFGGQGKQVRDLVHPHDLFDLINRQMRADPSHGNADIFNVGGGLSNSVSLREYTDLCQQVSGNQVEISSHPETAAVDIPYYVTDNSLVNRTFEWEAKRDAQTIVKDIYSWIKTNEAEVRPIFT